MPFTGLLRSLTILLGNRWEKAPENPRHMPWQFLALGDCHGSIRKLNKSFRIPLKALLKLLAGLLKSCPKL